MERNIITQSIQRVGAEKSHIQKLVLCYIYDNDKHKHFLGKHIVNTSSLANSGTFKENADKHTKSGRTEVVEIDSKEPIKKQRFASAPDDIISWPTNSVSGNSDKISDFNSSTNLASSHPSSSYSSSSSFSPLISPPHFIDATIPFRRPRLGSGSTHDDISFPSNSVSGNSDKNSDLTAKKLLDTNILADNRDHNALTSSTNLVSSHPSSSYSSSYSSSSSSSFSFSSSSSQNDYIDTTDEQIWPDSFHSPSSNHLQIKQKNSFESNKVENFGSDFTIIKPIVHASNNYKYSYGLKLNDDIFIPLDVPFNDYRQYLQYTCLPKEINNMIDLPQLLAKFVSSIVTTSTADWNMFESLNNVHKIFTVLGKFLFKVNVLHYTIPKMCTTNLKLW